MQSNTGVPARSRKRQGNLAAPQSADAAQVSRARSKAPVKARHADECLLLEQLPNIGPSLAADLRLIGIGSPQDLRSADGLQLYRQLCQATGQRQDPCVLDTFLAVTDFMRGAPAAPWWAYTAVRKQRFGNV